MSTKEEGAAILGQLRAMQAAADPGQHIEAHANSKGDPNANQFPARYLEPDPEDDVTLLKNRMASNARPAPLTDSDVGLVLRKMAATEVAKKDQWFASTWRADSSNPTMQRWAQSVYPEFYKRREQVIDEQTEIQRRLAKMKLYGIRSKDDFDLLHAIHQGYVEVKDTSLWNIKGETLGAPRRGLFNPFRVEAYKKPATFFENGALGPFPQGGNKTVANQYPGLFDMYPVPPQP